MLTMPSMWSLTISTLVFFIAAFYLNRFLNEQGVPRGMTRSILMLVFASLAGWGAGAASDWAEKTLDGPQAETQAPEDLPPMLK